jgi:hypothetical protein
MDVGLLFIGASTKNNNHNPPRLFLHTRAFIPIPHPKAIPKNQLTIWLYLSKLFN